MDLQIVGNPAFDLYKEPLELRGPVALVAFADDIAGGLCSELNVKGSATRGISKSPKSDSNTPR
jgi:hypothetical protein